jgi:tagaturonate reductase
VLAFSLAALVAFYRGTEIVDGALQGDRSGIPYAIRDDLPVLEEFARLWKAFDGSEAGARKLMEAVLANEAWWGTDLRAVPGLSAACGADLADILRNGARAAMGRVALSATANSVPEPA